MKIISSNPMIFGIQQSYSFIRKKRKDLLRNICLICRKDLKFKSKKNFIVVEECDDEKRVCLGKKDDFDVLINNENGFDLSLIHI